MSGTGASPGSRATIRRRGAASSATASVLLLRALLAGASALGLSREALAHAVNEPSEAFAPEALADPDARVPASLLLKLWQFLPTRCDDESFGFWLAERLQAHRLSLASWVISVSPSLGEGLKRSLRFQRLLHDEARSELELSATGAVYRHQVGSPPFRAPSAAIEFGLVSFLQLAQRITGSKVVPLRMRLRHAAPRDPSRHRAWFGPALEFDAPVDELVLDRASLERPLLGADPVLSQIVEAHASAALARLPTNSDIGARVRALISELLPQGTPPMELVCERLRLSRRTLQRKLSALDTSFANELDRTRHELSLRYLADSNISLQEATFLLGYSESSAFYRAFIRWTGEPPSAWRTRTLQLARPVER